VGLTIVEFVMEVEEAFGISIPDEDLGIETPRELVEYLLPRIPPPSDPEACATQRAFLALRRAIMEVLRVPRQRLRPETRWKDLLPRLGRAQAWNAITRTKRIPGRLPSLTRGWPLRILIGGAVMTTSAWQYRQDAVGTTVVLFAGFVGLGLLAITRPFLTPTCATIGDTAKHMVRTDPGERPTEPTWTREEVGRIVLKILNKQLERSDLTLDTRLADLE
jgi:hypothetical protein